MYIRNVKIHPDYNKKIVDALSKLFLIWCKYDFHFVKVYRSTSNFLNKQFKLTEVLTFYLKDACYW